MSNKVFQVSTAGRTNYIVRCFGFHETVFLIASIGAADHAGLRHLLCRTVVVAQLWRHTESLQISVVSSMDAPEHVATSVGAVVSKPPHLYSRSVWMFVDLK